MAQTNFTPILTYKSDTASAVPSAGNLTNSANGAELAVNTADKRLFTKDSGGNVVELGTNPSSLTLPNSTTNGVVYANGSKVLTTGSALTFDGTNLGVGTSTPVFSNSGQGIMVNGTTAGTVRVTQNGGTQAGEFRADANNVTIGSRTNGPLVFEQFGSEGMRLTSTGLGIGTSSPSAKLHVQTNNSTQVYLTGGSAGASSQRATIAFNDSGTNSLVISNDYVSDTNYTAFNIAGAERMRITGSGNLGIGTSSPAVKLETSSTSAGATVEVLRLSNPGAGANTQAQLKFFTTSTNYGTISGGYGASAPQMTFDLPHGTPGNYVWQISSSEKMRLDSSGNLAIATTGASGRVTIGNADSTGTGLYVNVNNTAHYLARFEYGGSTVGSITTNGTTVAYNISSDYRLKENIAPMTGALAKVAALKPVTYTWKADGSVGEGFIAHELAEVCPAAVTGEKDAVDAEGNPRYQGIDTSFLVATLTAALQEAVAEINQLKARLDAANL